MAELKQNRAKHLLQEGKTVVGVGATDPDTIESLGTLGVVDFIWIEMEHGPVVWSQLSDLSRACDLWGMTSLVRVTTNEPWLIGRTLDRGAQAVIIPHVNTKEEAQAVVHGAKFTPVGMRGMGGSRQGLGVAEYASKANDEIMVVVMIEDVVAVKNLKEILTVDNIDCFFVAPGDLSQSMGPQYLGRTDHPDVQKVYEGAIRQVVASGRVAGALANDGNVERYMDAGARFLYSNYQGYIANGLRAFRQKVDARVVAKPATRARAGTTRRRRS